MEFRVLGPLEVVEDGRELSLGGTKQRALLANLLLRANQVVSSERLIDELWGESPPATAAKAIQVYVSNLRKQLGERLLTRSPGYVLQVDPDEFDLARFEELLDKARKAAPHAAAESLRSALALWRGPALADLAYESFAQTDIARLEELRLAAWEERVEADLAVGRHAELVPELESLVARHPLRERLRSQLMLALYRSGRQAEALKVYQDARQTLTEELGLEPSPALQRLERAILAQDPALEPEPPAELERVELRAAVERSILLLPRDAASLGALLTLAEPLAASEPTRELILARVAEPGDSESLRRAASELNDRRAALVSKGLPARVAAFTSRAPAEDIVRLAAQQDVELVFLVAESSSLADELLDSELGKVLADAPCDVAVLVARAETPALDLDGPVLVPFGAGHHDWAALELAAWIARAHHAPLHILGSGELGFDGRDASRMLADASLLVQRCAGIAAEPLLTEPGRAGLERASEHAGLLVFALSERWRVEGLGPLRLGIAETLFVPTVFVRRGARPGGLAPAETLTRFTWSLGAAG
jgi:DNA-binding SARP family transcriptional activator